MNMRAKALLVAIALVCLGPATASAFILDFSQDFETLGQADPSALGADGWLYYVSVLEAGTGTWLNGYGGTAPNTDTPAGISRIVAGEGGLDQGAQQLSVFSDYNNQVRHTAGDTLNTNVYKEFAIEAGDVGKLCTFEFQAKMGNLVAPASAKAFIKTLDPSDNYAVTNFVPEDMTAIPTEWGGYSLSLTIDAGLVGQLFQVGFSNDATFNWSSGILYDNVVLTTVGGGPTGMNSYSQNFEALNAADTAALGGDGWLVYGIVYENGTGAWLGEYGPFAAPNNPGTPAFSTIAIGEGGAEQGAQQLSVFSDYENGAAHAAGDTVESIVYQEQTIGTADIGKTWYFQFEAKMPATGGVALPSTANAFIKTIDPSSGYAQTNFVPQDMTFISGDWNGWTLSLTIDAGLVGQLFQFGFSNKATSYNPSAIIYDNVVLIDDASPVPGGALALGASLRQNYPNPFNPMTRIEFSLEKQGYVDIAVYDLRGHLVNSLLSGNLDSGDHFVTWNGKTSSGTPAAAGQYHYVMKTEAGQVSRSMILLK